MTSGQSQFPVFRKEGEKWTVAVSSYIQAKRHPTADNVNKKNVAEDFVSVLTDSNNPKQYVKRMRQRDKELTKGWVQIIPTLWLETAGGKRKR